MDNLQSLTRELDTLSYTAEQRFHAQPRPTRTTITTEIRTIFQEYAQLGSHARLRHKVKTFLEMGDEGMAFDEALPPRNPDRLAATVPHSQRAPRSPSSSQSWADVGPGRGENSRTVDAESAELVAAPPDGMDFHLDRSFVLSADATIPQDLFESMDRVFGLYAQEAQLLLGHLCEKYGNEAVFRAGVRELIMSRTDTLFQSTSQHDLGLTPETQGFLFSVYERHPDLNMAETRILVRATRLDEETIAMFWDDMTERRKSYLAMRQLIAARELRELRREGQRKRN